MTIAVATPEAYQLLHRGSIALAKIEGNGVRIDVDYLNQSIKDVGIKIREAEDALRGDEHYTRWSKCYGNRLKLGSHEQMAHLLFEILKYPYPEKKTKQRGRKAPNKTGRKAKYLGDEETLSKVDIPLVKSFLRLKKLEKVHTTYLLGIQRELVGEYIHPFFNLHTVRSFRSSSSSINFQNLPIRDPVQGEVIRRCFIPRDGCYFTEIDFKGNEIVGNCCINRDPNLIDYVLHSPPKDMHRDTAMELFFLKSKEVAKQVRHVSKNRFVFPQFYGDFYASCARYIWEALDRPEVLKVAGSEETIRQRLAAHGITKMGACDPDQQPVLGTFEHHVREIESSFWGKRFKVYAQWRIDFFNEYLSRGWFELPTGFIIQGIYGRNEVTCYPAQGASFHCLLWTLIRLQDWITKYRMKTKIVGQIHDSIIADVPANEIQDYLNETTRIVAEDLPKHWDWLIVPLSMESEIAPLGESWHQKKPWHLHNGTWGPVAA